MPQPNQPSQPSLTERLFKPFLDYLGLNGAAALTASRRQPQANSNQEKPMTEDQLRKNGWDDKDIAWYRETHKIMK